MQNIKCPVCDSELSISDQFDVSAIKPKFFSYSPPSSRVHLMMSIIYLLLGALLAIAGVSLPGCSDDDNGIFQDDSETDTGEQLQIDSETDTGEQLQPDTGNDTAEQLQPDNETDTGEQLQPDTGNDTAEQLQPDTETDTMLQLQDMEPNPENCELFEPFLEVCKVSSLQPFINSCKGSTYTGYTLCVMECASKPLDECEINGIIFECTYDRCQHYKLCMQLCSH